MKRKIQSIYPLLSILLCTLVVSTGYAQQLVSGYVYQDKYRTPLDSVVVYTQSGNLAKSDSAGRYVIFTNGRRDSIWFQFRDKLTHKYPVDTIRDLENFEVQIYLPKGMHQDRKGYLPTVTVHSRNYLADSIQLRQDYARIFNYKKPGQALGESFGVTGGGIGVDINAIANLFRFGYNKRQQVYQKFALQIEQDRYIRHRFTKKLVEEITGLYDQKRDEYMRQYQPEYKALIMMNDLQLAKYIKITYDKFTHKSTNDKIKNNIFLSPYSQRHQEQ